MNHRRTSYKRGLDHAAEEHPSHAGWVALLGLIFLLTGCLFFLQACNTAEAKKEKNNMAMAEMQTTLLLEKPPIDLSAPAETETATFSLG